MSSTYTHSFPRIELKMVTFITVMAAYFSLVMNYPVIAKIFELSQGAAHPWFPYTAPLLLFFCFIIIFSLFALPYVFKPLLAFITLTSAAALYASVNFQTMFDSTMMESVFETNLSEASFYFNISSVLYVTVFGLIPTVFIFSVEIIAQKTWMKALVTRASLLVIALVGILLIAAVSYKDYASVGRNNKYLSKMIIPAHIYSAVKYVDKTHFTTQLAYRQQGQDAKLQPAANGKPTLLVLVLGETARAMNFTNNGYARETNPYTKNLGLISFQDVSACGTYTALSVPCMFSSLGRTDYDKHIANAQDNVLNVIAHAGVDILWIDNDGGDKGVAKKLPYIQIQASLKDQDCDGKTCFDSAMLDDADNFIQHNVTDKLLVLHTIGSHGPTYWQRYPQHMGTFSPACNRSDIEKCTDDEITNVYDNTLVYTDYILSQVIEKLEGYAEQYNVAMLYISDHGESLGEKGLYLHGTPYAIAPEEQIKVPWLLWLPNEYATQKGIDRQCLANEARTNAYSHDNFFHSLLSFYGVATQVSAPSLDVIQQCKVSQHG